MTDTRTTPWSRLTHVLFVGGIAIAAFFLGTRHLEHDQDHAHKAPHAPPSGAKPARSYREIQQNPYAANPASLATLEALRASRPKLLEPVVREPERLQETLSARASLRAFAGAPPVVPHPVKQRGALDCLSCHQRGLEIAGRVAPAISHPAYAACTQCHVPSSAPQPSGDPDTSSPPFDSDFAPMAEVAHGARAMAGSPPTMPHTTHMRQECSSCHGVLGRPGMRTSHPERAQCTQCHAPSAALDQRGSELPFPMRP